MELRDQTVSDHVDLCIGSETSRAESEANRTAEEKETSSHYTDREKELGFEMKFFSQQVLALTTGAGDNGSWKLTILFAKDRDLGRSVPPKVAGGGGSRPDLR